MRVYKIKNVNKPIDINNINIIPAVLYLSADQVLLPFQGLHQVLKDRIPKI